MTLPRLISSDSHVKLDHDQVKALLASRWHQEYDDAVAGFDARMARSSASKQNLASLETRSYPSAGRAGWTDPSARLADMDIDGVDVEVLYCEVSAFRYLYEVKTGWREATRAFNDAMWSFGSKDPSRLVVNAQIPINDTDAACAEIERVARLGIKSLQLPVFPTEVGVPDYYHDRYDRMFDVIEDMDLPVCFHIGLNLGLESLINRDPTPGAAIFVATTSLATAEPLGMLVCSGLFERHPRLKAVFVEPGVGWVAWWLRCMDDMKLRQGYEFPGLKELPSFYFHRNVSLTFIDEPDTVQLLRSQIGVENIMWSSDYPHPVSSWPRSREIVETQFRGVPEHERDLIVGGNAARIWNLRTH
jgi:predicted TIM-barrel fold metal-dependent hydrolase